MTAAQPPSPGAVQPEDIDDDASPAEIALVTGFPAFSARQMAIEVLTQDPQATVYLLARQPFVEQAQQLRADLPAHLGSRLLVVEGDVCSMDLGLSGAELRMLSDQVTTIYHLAGIYYMGVDEATARKVNIEGTRGVLRFAEDAGRLRRLCHFSTATVAGKRKGVVLEDELDVGQTFNNFYESTKFEAEKLAVSAQRTLPVTIFRPGIIVGNSRTGELGKLDGPYYLFLSIAKAPNQLKLALPLGDDPLHLVPIDYVTRAAFWLSRDPRAVGKTFHLTDPNPLSARRVYDLVAQLTHGTKSRTLPAGLGRALLPIQRLGRVPPAAREALGRPCLFNTRQALELLAPVGILCPPIDRYADRLLAYVRDTQAAQRDKLADEVFDPFE